MNRIFNIFLFVLLSTPLLSQTELDMMVFQKINEHRISNGLSKLQFSSVGFDAAEHHTNYLAEFETSGHIENTNETSTPKRRLSHYGSGYTGLVGENCTEIVDRNESIEKQANTIFERWLNSPNHNQIMLNENFKYGAVSCVKYSGILSGGDVYKRVFSTFITWN